MIGECLNDIHSDQRSEKGADRLLKNRTAPTNQYLIASVSKNFCKSILALCAQPAQKRCQVKIDINRVD